MKRASPSSGKFGAVHVDSMLARREKKRFLKDSYPLPVLDGFHRRSCIQKIATAEQLGTQWPSEPISMTLITVP